MANERDLPMNEAGEVQLDVRRFFAWLPQYYQQIVVADTGHTNAALTRFFRSDDFLGGLKDGGTEVVATEVEKDKYAALQHRLNEASPQEWVDKKGADKFEDVGGAIRAHDMKVAFVDVDRERRMVEYMKSQGVGEARATMAAQVGTNCYYQLGKLSKAISSDSPFSNFWKVMCDGQFWKGFLDIVLHPIASFTGLWHSVGIAKDRLQGTNAEVAQNVKQAKTERPIAVIFGATHMDRVNGRDKNGDGKIDFKEADLDEMLGKGTVHVAVYETEAEFREKTLLQSAIRFVAKHTLDITKEDVPDYVIFLDGNGGKGKVVKTKPEEKVPPSPGLGALPSQRLPDATVPVGAAANQSKFNRA